MWPERSCRKILLPLTSNARTKMRRLSLEGITKEASRKMSRCENGRYYSSVSKPGLTGCVENRVRALIVLMFVRRPTMISHEKIAVGVEPLSQEYRFQPCGDGADLHVLTIHSSQTTPICWVLLITGAGKNTTGKGFSCIRTKNWPFLLSDFPTYPCLSSVS